MHILTIVIIVAIGLIILMSRNKNEANEVDDVQGNPAGELDRYPVAFVSRGKLFYRKPGGDVVQVHSPYVQSVMDRMERSRQLHGWKEGTAFSVSMTGGMREGPGANVEIQATSAQFVSNDCMIYSMRDESVGGLFSQQLSDGTENRLLHKQNLVLEDLALSPDKSRLLCSAHAKNGTSNVAMLNADGSDYQEVTAGDTVDTHAAWVPGQPDSILYQSSGIARNSGGFAVAQGPASIQLLNTQSGELESVREDPAWDFMQPKVGSDGCLYFIRRPYEAQHYGPKNVIVDALMFPFRLLRAVFHYLNFFSMMYTRKPLTSASGPRVDADLKGLIVKGKRFDAEQAIRSGKRVGGVPSVVPATWQLIRRTTRGEESVIARNVASFDISSDGVVLFTNGYGLFAVDSSTQPRVVFKGKLMADVVAGASDTH